MGREKAAPAPSCLWPSQPCAIPVKISPHSPALSHLINFLSSLLFNASTGSGFAFKHPFLFHHVAAVLRGSSCPLLSITLLRFFQRAEFCPLSSLFPARGLVPVVPTGLGTCGGAARSKEPARTSTSRCVHCRTSCVAVTPR